MDGFLCRTFCVSVSPLPPLSLSLFCISLYLVRYCMYCSTVQVRKTQHEHDDMTSSPRCIRFGPCR